MCVPMSMWSLITVSGHISPPTSPTSIAERQACCITCLTLSPDSGMPQEERLHVSLRALLNSSPNEQSIIVNNQLKRKKKKKKSRLTYEIYSAKKDQKPEPETFLAQEQHRMMHHLQSLPNASSRALKHHTPNPGRCTSFPSLLWESLTWFGCRIFEISKSSSDELSAEQRAVKPGPQRFLLC